MRSPIQYQRQMVLQIHCGINAFCFLVTLICIFCLAFDIGFLEVIALIVPIIGVLALFLNTGLGKGRRVMKDCYVIGSLASILSLFLASQVVIQFCYSSWILGFLYFLITGAAIAGIGYLIFMGNTQFLYKCMTPVMLTVALIIGVLLAIVIYRFILRYCFAAGFVLFLGYFLWLVDLVLTIFICLDLRILLLKGR